MISLAAGMVIQYQTHVSGEVRLQINQPQRLVMRDDSDMDSLSQKGQMGITLTLDSVRISDYTPEFEITLWSLPSGREADTSTHQSSGYSLAGQFPMDTMKIRPVGETDFYFRLREFYPNFTFAYRYPEYRDTIAVNNPGITLELNTSEGNPIVTLQAEPTAKSKLKDLVGLGAGLNFYSEISRDTIDAMLRRNEFSENQILFSGTNHIIYYFLDGTLREDSLEENKFYPMPGQDSVGFKVLYNFPDLAYLQAVPATDGQEPLNPVAHIEVWRAGQGAQDAFVYPETRGKKGGDYIIPASDYKIGFRKRQDQAVQNCNCTISVMEADQDLSTTFHFTGSKAQRYKNLSIHPLDCSQQHFPSVLLSIHQRAAQWPYWTGIALFLIAFLFMFMRRR